MLRKLVAANWKENPATERASLILFKKIARMRPARNADIVICPPFVYLEKIAEEHRRRARRKIMLGAQDVFWEEKGPYTSEVGPKMLRSIGVQYVIIGHSERRKWLKETDAMINKKVRLALADKLKVILCVGEAFPVRKKGIAAAKKFVGAQLAKDLKGVKAGDLAKNVTVAYEPIWAIGTGRYDRPEDAAEMADFIRKTASKGGRAGALRVLYGGSVNKKNIADYVQYKGIQGALVGGASLKAEEFKKITAVVAAAKI